MNRYIAILFLMFSGYAIGDQTAINNFNASKTIFWRDLYLDKITIEIGEQKLSGEVMAVTQVNGKPLFFYWFRRLENIRAIGEVESDLSQWIISVQLVN
jgi:hypothetical protein